MLHSSSSDRFQLFILNNCNYKIKFNIPHQIWNKSLILAYLKTKEFKMIFLISSSYFKIVIFSDSDSEWTQPMDNTQPKCAEHHNLPPYQHGSTSGYSSESLRPNIIVNHCETDPSWTPFIHRHSQESVI